MGYNWNFVDAVSFEAGRHEVSILRSQTNNISMYKPLHLYIPYGKCILDDRTEVLFNRDYCPLWSRSLSGTVEELDLLYYIDFSIAEHFLFDRNAPYTKNGRANLEKCLNILQEWGVANRHHNIFDQFKEAVKSGRVGDIIPSRFS